MQKQYQSLFLSGVSLRMGDYILLCLFCVGWQRT